MRGYGPFLLIPLRSNPEPRSCDPQVETYMRQFVVHETGPGNWLQESFVHTFQSGGAREEIDRNCFISLATDGAGRPGRELSESIYQTKTTAFTQRLLAEQGI